MTATAAAMPSASLTKGQPAPDFSLLDENGSAVSLVALRGTQVALYFYPKDDTPGCTIEAKDFRDRMSAFESANTVIIGVSRDDAKSHAAFKKKYCLPFTLAVDDKGEACNAYGVWVEKSMYGKKYMGIERATFLIDAAGMIANVWPKVKVEGHAQAVLEAAEALRA